MHLHDRLDPDRVGLDRNKRELDAVQPQRMAKRNQLARPLRRHDPRQPRDFQHISLGQPTIPHQGERRRLQPDPAAGPRRAQRHLLARDVHHPARPALIEMRQLAHDRASRFVQFILKIFYESSARRLEGRGQVPQVFGRAGRLAEIVLAWVHGHGVERSA